MNKTSGVTLLYNKYNSGLPTNDITAILVDGNGDKWIGTYYGDIVKFDGTVWTIYNASITGLPIINKITTISIDEFGNKWIGSSTGGVVKFDGTSWTKYNASNSMLPDDYVFSIANEENGNTWIGTFNGLAKLNGNNWTIYNASNSGIGNDVRSIAIEGNGNKWIGTTSGLYKFDGYNWTNCMTTTFSINTIKIDASGNKWIGVNQGLIKLENSNWNIYNPVTIGLNSTIVKSILIDADGNKWIGTEAGIVKFDDVNWTIYKPNYFKSITEDINGNKWAGGVGFVKFDSIKWTTYNDSSRILHLDYINVVISDSVGNIWIGTDGFGISKFDGTNWVKYNSSNSGLINNHVNSIVIDGNGNKWIGTDSHGISKFDGTNWTTYDVSNSGLTYNEINNIIIDGSGNPWIGTTHGISKFDGTNWTSYNTSNSGLINNNILSTAVEGGNIIWIGTSNGISKFDGTNWTTYTPSNSGLPSNNTGLIFIDRSGNKLISTNNGFVEFNGAIWTIYNFSSLGMPISYLKPLMIDQNNNKWFMHNDGLAVFNENGVLQGNNNLITSQPTNQNVTLGHNASFIVDNQNQNISYQWQSNSGGNFVNLSNTGQYSGTASNTLSIAGTTQQNSGQKFRCIVISGTYADTSNFAILTVCPAIINQPVSINKNIGENAQFITQSSDTTAIYQWQSDIGLGFTNLADSGLYNGTTNDTLTVSGIIQMNNGQKFRCIVSSGNCISTSDIAVLTICPAILTQPINLNKNIGENAQFTYESSDMNADYQWQSDIGLGFINLANAGQYSGVNTKTLHISSLSQANNNQSFRCLMNLGVCNDTSNIATLTVSSGAGFNENNIDIVFSVKSNPVEKKLIVIIRGKKEFGSFNTDILNLNGQILLQQTINQFQTEIDIHSLSNGIYFLKLNTNKGIIMKKFVVSR